jgi:hypothetical protein
VTRSRWRESRALVVAFCIATALLAGSALAAADVAGVPGMAPFSFFDDWAAALDPGGTGKIPNALILGCQLALTL